MLHWPRQHEGGGNPPEHNFGHQLLHLSAQEELAEPQVRIPQVNNGQAIPSLLNKQSNEKKTKTKRQSQQQQKNFEYSHGRNDKTVFVLVRGKERKSFFTFFFVADVSFKHLFLKR